MSTTTDDFDLPRSGVPGVNWVRGKWRVQIKVRGQGRYVGVFDADKLDEAILAREAAMEVAKSELMRTVIA